MVPYAENQKRLIVDCARELDIRKWVGVVVDIASVMQKSTETIKTEFPKIFGNGCCAHGVNLLIKNSIRQFYRNLVHCQSLFQITRISTFKSNKPKFAIKHVFMIPVETRFYTYFTFGNSVIENKTGLRRGQRRHQKMTSGKKRA